MKKGKKKWLVALFAAAAALLEALTGVPHEAVQAIGAAVIGDEPEAASAAPPPPATAPSVS